MGMDYTYEVRLPTPGRVQELLDKVDADLSELYRIEGDLSRMGLDPTRDPIFHWPNLCGRR
jgi:hypothetical protein